MPGLHPLPGRSATGTTANEDRYHRDGLHLGLIDPLQLSRDCLARAFMACDPSLIIATYVSIAECLQTPPNLLDIVVYYSHEDPMSEPLTLRDAKTLRRILPAVPLIILSDSLSTPHARGILDAAESGAQGFVPTSTTDVPHALAAIRFVRNGGTFVPLQFPLSEFEAQSPAVQEPPSLIPLTRRQRAVLSLLRKGKANKIIAHELGMTESTVKVHVRNIMRKMGATNRTHAVYLADLRQALGKKRSPEE